MGCEAAPNQAASVVSGTSRRLVLLSVPDSSRTSPLLRKPRYPGQAKRRPVRAHKALRPAGRGTCPRWAAKRNQNRPPWLYLVHRGGWFLLPVPGSSRTSEASPGPHTQRASARRAWERTCPRWAAKRPQTRPLRLYLVHRGGWFCCRSPTVRGQVRSYENRDIPDKRSVARSVHIKRFGPQGVGLVRDGLRSGPKPGRFGCIWYIEAAGFAVGPRQFADKRSVARSAHTTRFCPKGVGADLSAMGCEAEPKPATLVVSGAPRRMVFAAGSRQFADKSAPTKDRISRTSEASPKPVPRLRPAQSTVSIREGCIGRVARREVFIKAVFMNPSCLGS
ncbi:hypothetical protein PSCFBP3800_01644 [Pseudomonas syringae group genomosp. 3]|nr:hypothetical protein PSCFBP3800_01644 [Pseudomonas syringae group genomosp. 3]